MQAQYIDQPAPAYGPQPAHDSATSSPLPYTPLPQRRGTARTVFLVAIALVIPGLIFGVRALTDGESGGSDSPQAATDPKGTDPQGTDPKGSDAKGPDSKQTGPDSDDPDSEDPESDGPTVEGAGYEYAVPEGWGIRPDMVREFSLDAGDSVVAVSRPDHGFETNVLVTSTEADGFTIDEAKRAWTPKDGQVTPMQPTTLDGVEAIGIRNETVSDGGRPIVQLGYLTVRDDWIYSIVLSVPVQSVSDSQSALNAVLESWSWADGEPATGEPAPSTT